MVGRDEEVRNCGRQGCGNQKLWYGGMQKTETVVGRDGEDGNYGREGGKPSLYFLL